MTFETHQIDFPAPDEHHAVCLTARGDKGVLGSLQIQNWHTPNPSICWVFVQEHRRRLGVGRAMIREAAGVSRAAGKQSLILGVMKGNDPAQRLYRSEGFRQYQSDEKQDYLVLFL